MRKSSGLPGLVPSCCHGPATHTGVTAGRPRADRLGGSWSRRRPGRGAVRRIPTPGRRLRRAKRPGFGVRVHSGPGDAARGRREGPNGLIQRISPMFHDLGPLVEEVRGGGRIPDRAAFVSRAVDSLAAGFARCRSELRSTCLLGRRPRNITHITGWNSGQPQDQSGKALHGRECRWFRPSRMNNAGDGPTPSVAVMYLAAAYEPRSRPGTATR